MNQDDYIKFDKSDLYIKRLHDKYAEKVNKSSKESDQFIREVCLYCSLYARCIEYEKYYPNDHRARRLCILLSSDSKQVWLDVSDRRKTFVFDNKYGMLTPFAYHKRIKGRWYILCVCECGNIVSVRQNNLVTGNTTSCGCIKRRKGSVKDEIFTERLSQTTNILYERRYAENPDPSSKSRTEDAYLHPFRIRSYQSLNAYSSPVGQSVWDLIEICDKNNRNVRYVWTVLKCDECGGIVRLDERMFPVCEKCGLVCNK